MTTLFLWASERRPAVVDPPGAAAVERPPRALVRWRALLRTMRPKQWSKNALVLAAPCSAGVVTHDDVVTSVAGAFVAFCLLSSAAYLLNDVRDAEHDRVHPHKRTRPVAAGELPVGTALCAAAAAAAGGVLLAAAIAPALALLGAAYLAVTVSYSLWWRMIVGMDVLAIALGFVLRAVAGGAAAGIPLSRAFLIVAGSGAMFLVAGKRYAELGECGADGRAGALLVRRSALRHYTPAGLRALLAGSAAVALVSYAVWALRGPSAGVWHLLSIVPLALWLARYSLLLGRGQGQSPEATIAGDAALLGLGGVWAVLFLTGVYAAV